MGEPVEERDGHLGVAEDRRPFAQGQVGGDDASGDCVASLPISAALARE